MLSERKKFLFTMSRHNTLYSREVLCGNAQINGVELFSQLFNHAASLSSTFFPARVAKVISISRLNLSHLPRIRSDTRD